MSTITLDCAFDSNRLRAIQPLLHGAAKAHEQAGRDILDSTTDSDALRVVTFAQYEGAIQALELSLRHVMAMQHRLAENAHEARKDAAVRDLLNPNL